MNLKDIQLLIKKDLEATDTLILESLSSNVTLINEVSNYIVNSGGKRLRPILTLLSANACGYKGSIHHVMAAVIEFIHTSTLLHDDVVDGSDYRRGKKTANEVWGNSTSVLVGDFLYSRAFEMMVKPNNMQIMQVMSKATNVIAEGEVLQLLNCKNIHANEQSYLDVIHRKTAKLFESATQMGAILSNKKEYEKPLASYGLFIGTAFQLIDDILDYTADTKNLGKNIGDDLAEGKITLPLIYVLKNGTDKEKTIIKQAILSEGIKSIDKVCEIIKHSGAVKYTYEVARKETVLAKNSIKNLPSTPYKKALLSLADISIKRSY